MSSYMTYISNGDIKWIGGIGYGLTFREDGPCRITNFGDVAFSQLNSGVHYNRKTGPTRISACGCIEYVNINGIKHRTTGPAVVRSDGEREYWVNGFNYTAEEFFLKFGVL